MALSFETFLAEQARVVLPLEACTQSGRIPLSLCLFRRAYQLFAATVAALSVLTPSILATSGLESLFRRLLLILLNSIQMTYT